MAKIYNTHDFSKSAPMYNDCIEFIQLLARPDDICRLPRVLIFQPESREYTVYVHAAKVSPAGKIYVHYCFNDETPDLHNQEQWHHLDLAHYVDRLMIGSVYLALYGLANDAMTATDHLLSELHIEKEEAV